MIAIAKTYGLSSILSIKDHIYSYPRFFDYAFVNLMNIRTVTSKTPSLLGEGVFCKLANKYDLVMWVDILGHKIYHHNLYNHDLSEYLVDKCYFDGHPSVIVPIKSSSDYLVAFQNAIVQWNIEKNAIKQIYAGFDNHDLRFNDGKCDPLGRLWVGTTHLEDQPETASLYRMDRDGSKFVLTPVIKGVSISNGITWSLDSQFMYYIDTPTRVISVYQYDIKTGDIGDSPFCMIDLSQEVGVPDGMNIDNRGFLWVALWDGSQVICIDPRVMEVVDRIKLPVSRPTNVTISHQSPGRLYVTSAYVEGESQSGHLLIVDTGGAFLNGGSYEFAE
jgi:sugar lactone lactonase YvrE